MNHTGDYVAFSIRMSTQYIFQNIKIYNIYESIETLSRTTKFFV